jgi:beta-glucanase (GH16 family)
MLPIDLRYGVWASSGEIDMYEMKNEFIRNNMALHYGGPWPKYSERFNTYERRPGGGSFSDSFTVVTMDWSPTEINMYMDGELAFSDKSKSVDRNGWYSKSLNGGPNTPFDMPFYIILNLAIGGKYPGDSDAATLSPNTMVRFVSFRRPRARSHSGQLALTPVYHAHHRSGD